MRSPEDLSTMPNNNGSTTSDRGTDLGEMVDRARGNVEDFAGRARDAIQTADRTLQAKMRDNPLLVLGIAVGVGYVIGRIFSRVR
jgi:ElaB/YqjD/DUF883 family membrane-anchored ribosome-binding protein